VVFDAHVHARLVLKAEPEEDGALEPAAVAGDVAQALAGAFDRVEV
jgi:hypothetical protein